MRLHPALRRAAAMLAVLLGLPAAGCSLLLPDQAKTYFVLQDLRDVPAPQAQAPALAPQARQAGKPPRLPAVLVSVNQASTLYETAGIVFSRGAGERGYYQFANWSERPSRRLGLMVERRLVKAIGAGAPLAGAALDTSGVRGDWVLAIRLADLYHDANTAPQQAVVAVEVELVDWERRRMLDRGSFSAAVDLRPAQVPVQAAVAAMNEAMTAVLDQVDEWVAEAARKAEAANDAANEAPNDAAREAAGKSAAGAGDAVMAATKRDPPGTPPTSANRRRRPCPGRCR